MSEEVTVLLCSKKRLNRDRGLAELKKVLEGDPSDVRADVEQLEAKIVGLIAPDAEEGVVTAWETKHGGLMAALVLIPGASERFCVKVKGAIPKLLESGESRVRLLAGEVLGQLFARRAAESVVPSEGGDCEGGVSGESGGDSDGVTSLWGEVEPLLVKGIKENIERDIFTSAMDNPELVQKLRKSSSSGSFGSSRSSVSEEEEEEEGGGGGERPYSPSTAQMIFHNTAGWKSLETYMSALQHVVVGCGVTFEPFITSDLLELVFTTLKHENRFVRETGYKVLAAIVKCPGLTPSTMQTHWPNVARQLAEGLSDNWSQVRMSASVATRDFLQHIQPKEAREDFLPTLLPAMCINRYYVAEGVKLYSQETWREVTENRGVEMVEEHIKEVVGFYISQSQASNHAVREAACTCIAELGNKVSHDCLRPYVGRLVMVLLECFKDDSWPVRDAACLACGNFVGCFPDECRPFLDELFQLFLGNLEDSIPSVRQGAALAIANVVKAYGAEMEDKVFSVVKERIPLVETQPQTQDLHPGVDPSPAAFGVVRRVSGDDAAHSDQQMYSCGSLAPKMRKGSDSGRRGEGEGGGKGGEGGRSGGGCMHSTFHKPAQLWEKSEGCVHLLAELSKLKECVERVSKALPLVAEATRHKQYLQHYNYLEVVMRQLPVFARSLGKRTFKRHLELFLDPIFYSISCESPLAKVAAIDCLDELNKQLGRAIMRGRVEQHNPMYLRLYDSACPPHH